MSKHRRLHGRAAPTFSINGGTTYVPHSLAEHRGLFSRAAVGHWKTQADRLAHPTPNSPHDPVSAALVLDCIMRLEHDTPFYAKDLTNILTIAYPQMIWDAYTVGRILRFLAEAAEDSGCPVSPIESGKDYEGFWYQVNKNEMNWEWIGKARFNMGAAADKLVEKERRDKKLAPRRAFPFESIETIDWGDDKERAA
jgi:hypothetical protein